MNVVALFGLIGLVMGAVAAKMFASARQQRTRGVRVVGEVIRHGEYTSGGQTMYVPIFKVVLAGGAMVESEAAPQIATTSQRPPIGTKRDLVYHGAMKPVFTRLDSTSLAPALIAGVIGAGFAVAAVAIAMFR